MRRLTIRLLAGLMLLILLAFGSGSSLIKQYKSLSIVALAQGACPAVQNTPNFTIAYGAVTVNGSPAPAGSVVEVRSPRDDVVGCFTVTNAGNYGAMYIYGEDTSVDPIIDGMRSGEVVNFFINGVLVTANLNLTWSNDKAPHAVNLSGTGTVIQGTVTLQGRPAAPNSRWEVPLTVNIFEPGISTPQYQFAPVTDENGSFVSFWLIPGTYNVAVKNRHTLQNVKPVTITAGTNVVNFGTLREGDANNDNIVDIFDFSLLASAFNTCTGNIAYKVQADFNLDTCIDIFDFSLLASNFNLSGDTAP